MFGLASPIWLAALAALAIPVIVHLWNLRPRRTIAFGSLRFLQEAAASRSLSRWFSQWTLLLLRCLLLAALAVWLAGPFWRGVDAFSSAGWVLVSPELLRDLRDGGERYQLQEHQLAETLASLESAGHELRLFDHGFPISPRDGNPADSGSTDYWSLFRELDSRTDTPREVWIFTPGGVASLRGKRPATGRKVIWHAIPPRGSRFWIEDAFTVEGRLSLVVGESDAGRTLWHRRETPLPEAEKIIEWDGPAQLEVLANQDGGGTVRIVEDQGRGVLASALFRPLAPLVIQMSNPPDRGPDASYLTEALRAIGEWSGRPLRIEALPARELPGTPESSLTFQVGSADVPHAAAFFVDSGDASYRTAHLSWLVPGSNQSAPIPLWRRTEAARGVPLWLDSSGEPLLVLEEATGNLRLATRLHPGWSGLVFDSSFVELLYHWLLVDPLARRRGPEPGLDQRQADPSQFDPAQPAEARPGAAPSQFDLSTPFWLLLLALFCLERWIADRKVPA